MDEPVSVLVMKPWPGLAQYAGASELARSQGRLFLYDTGYGAHKKPPIILIHGLGDEADSWRHLFPLLAEERRVLAPDLPGFGRSSAGGRVSLAAHVAAITRLLRETGPAVVVGSSMGAAVAELVAFKIPHEVLGLVLLDGGLPSGGALSPAVLRMLTPFVGERTYRAFRRDHEAAYRSLEPYYADLSSLPEADKAFLRDRVIERVESETQLRAYFASLRSFVAAAAFHGASYGPKLAAYDGPVLIGWGVLDRIMPRVAADILKNARPDAELVFFSGAGHLPHQETPIAVADAITAFSAAITSRKS